MCKISKLILSSVLLALLCAFVDSQIHHAKNTRKVYSNPNSQKKTDEPKKLFDGFVKKSSMTAHYEKMSKMKMADEKRRYGRSIMQVIDRVDELVAFDIDKVEDPVIANASSGRRYFRPPGRTSQYHYDPFMVRPRIYELMKQTIYEVRDMLPYVIELREKYRNHSLYKMGYLFSKLDDVGKSFHQIALKYYQFTRTAKDQYANQNNRMHSTMIAEMFERVLNHWFEYDLLIDVVRINDNLARRTLRTMKKLEDLATWFTDSFDDVYYVFKLAAKQVREKQEEKERKMRFEKELAERKEQYNKKHHG